jgi:ABC-2 type transport system permease protein
MSTARSPGEAPRVTTTPPRAGGLEWSALGALFTLTLRQILHGRRMLVLAALALLPALLAVLVRTTVDARHGPPLSEIEFVCLFVLIPQALLPLTALLYGSGMILDEQEEQTLTYLLIRPLPKWALYLTKLLATVCMIALLGLVFVVIAYAATYLGSAELFDVFPLKALQTFAVMALALLAYTAVFGCLSLLVQRSMIAGITYIVGIEGVLANIDLPLRKLTVMYYFRVLTLNWLSPDPTMASGWSIGLADAPSPFLCVLTLLLVSVATTFLGAWAFSRKELHVKTPEPA